MAITVSLVDVLTLIFLPTAYGKWTQASWFQVVWGYKDSGSQSLHCSGLVVQEMVKFKSLRCYSKGSAWLRFEGSNDQPLNPKA